MHTLARRGGRDPAQPRYYYRLSERAGLAARMAGWARTAVTFLFSQVQPASPHDWTG